ncbi:lysoplasmalogenase [Pedobacter frigiditerrae]|uniref:Lysoplasmalogenase n=1 Tax=Pedobacter frigiditerrae TaxID=2530452 RepID=A0A4R0MTK7_9SPHI|nr:lysoplasmalogenase [Pedobacter frigiditerrae]TCC90398.1 lysoplasmalogenase [Pedobacter frigiditerrae]
MLQKYLQFSIAFAFIFIIQILMESDSKTAKLVLADFYYIVKPLITISLMIFYAYQTQLRGRFAKRIFSGLFFGLVGDSFLMFLHVNSSFFMFGLIAFLIGHLCYISAFYLDYKWNPAIEKKSTWLALIVFGVFCLSFYLFLRPYLGAMKIPVMVYAFVISLMGIMAVNRKGRVNRVSFNLIFFGALAFLISDSILAYNKFVNPFNGAGIAIMTTYMLAQYLITVGSVERKLKKATAIDEVKS